MITLSASVMPVGESDGGAGLRIHDLGSLVVEVDEIETPFGETKPGRILTVLVVDANRRVSVDAFG